MHEIQATPSGGAGTPPGRSRLQKFIPILFDKYFKICNNRLRILERKKMKKLSPQEQLDALELEWNLNEKLICDGCEQPLEIDMSCYEQMAESVDIDMKEFGYVRHVVLRCENALGMHQDECNRADCDYNDGDKYHDGIICHNFNTWVDLWDDRFSDNPTGPELNKYSGARLLND